MSTPVPADQVPVYSQPVAVAAPMPVPAAFLSPPPAVAPAPVVEQPTAPQPAPLPQIQAVQSIEPSVQIPEGGYARRIVRVPLPQLHLEGMAEPWIEMRNPGLMSTEALEQIGKGLQGIRVAEGEEPTAEDEGVIYETVAQLLRRWCMWDGSSVEDTPSMLPEIPTAALLRRVPLVVVRQIVRAFQELQDPQ